MSRPDQEGFLPLSENTSTQNPAPQSYFSNFVEGLKSTETMGFAKDVSMGLLAFTICYLTNKLNPATDSKDAAEYGILGAGAAIVIQKFSDSFGKINEQGLINKAKQFLSSPETLQGFTMLAGSAAGAAYYDNITKDHEYQGKNAIPIALSAASLVANFAPKLVEFGKQFAAHCQKPSTATVSNESSQLDQREEGLEMGDH